jgi:hypothetical protein
MDIASILAPEDGDQHPWNASVHTTTVTSTTADSRPLSAAASVPTTGQPGTDPSEVPAKKQSQWTPEDISKQLPGRSAINCRLRCQNYLEERIEWDEDRKNKLAYLYGRLVEHCVATAESTRLKHRARFKSRCGHQSQRRCPSPGERRKPCTGNLANRGWQGERASRRPPTRRGQAKHQGRDATHRRRRRAARTAYRTQRRR